MFRDMAFQREPGALRFNPRLVDTPTRAPRALGDDEGDASATTADDDDDGGGGLGGDHFSNLACIRMWNSRLA